MEQREHARQNPGAAVLSRASIDAPTISDRALNRAGVRCGYQPQFALLLDFASDASAVLASGVCPQSGCLAIPTENTHGYEMVLADGISACARTLSQYLVDFS